MNTSIVIKGRNGRTRTHWMGLTIKNVKTLINVVVTGALAPTGWDSGKKKPLRANDLEVTFQVPPGDFRPDF